MNARYCADESSPNETQIQAYLETIARYVDDARVHMDALGCAVSGPIAVQVVGGLGALGRVRGDAVPLFLDRAYVDTNLAPGGDPARVAGTVAHEYIHILQKAIVGTHTSRT